jgi:murein DD-endopeptidase MepM/ murein hydrolase activator NlpD
MVMNIIQTSMTAQKQFTGGSSAWDISPLYNVSEQVTKTKPKVTTNKSAINKYKLPLPKDLLQRVDRTSSPGIPVLAAEDGLVTAVKDTSNTGGASPSNWRHTNFIVIMHSNGEYSRYDHLS